MKEWKCPISLVVKAWAKDGKKEVHKDGDLILDNFAELWRQIFCQWRRADSTLCTMKDVNGNNQSFYVWWNGAVSWNRQNQEFGCWIRVGDGGSIAPARTDYSLGNFLDSKKVDNPGTYGVDGITFSTTFIWNQDNTINECGVAFRMYDRFLVSQDILWFKDTIPVISGKTITVEYSINLS